MDAKPKRALSYSLRTLFVVTTILCVWLGYELSIIRQRQAVRKEMEATQKYQFILADTSLSGWTSNPPLSIEPPARIPLQRRLLGDAAIQIIWYQYSENGDAERAKLARVFPEAEIREILYEPCHPGCFPRGTLVETPRGSLLIENLVVGDVILSPRMQGEVVEARIDSIFRTDNRLWEIETDCGTLLTTSIQPLLLASRRLKPAGELSPGDELLRFVDGQLRPARVQQVNRTERVEEVFNIVVQAADHFIAGGFVARCKPPALAGASATAQAAQTHQHESN